MYIVPCRFLAGPGLVHQPTWMLKSEAQTQAVSKLNFQPGWVSLHDWHRLTLLAKTARHCSMQMCTAFPMTCCVCKNSCATVKGATVHRYRFEPYSIGRHRSTRVCSCSHITIYRLVYHNR